MKKREVDNKPTHIGQAIVPIRIQMRSSLKHLKQLSKFLTYVLGRQPDEFGLIPDDQGFVAIKKLFQALHEDPEWRHINRSHLNALLISLPQPHLEIVDNTIRAIDRAKLPELQPAQNPPKLLYTCVRNRAYPVVAENGIRPMGGLPYVVLTLEKSMALQLGRRIDNLPILLTVQTKPTHFTPPPLLQYGSYLFLIDYLPPSMFTGPPLTKDISKTEKPKPANEKMHSITPGSYFPDPGLRNNRKSDSAKFRKSPESEWKRRRRQARKEKQRQQG